MKNETVEPGTEAVIFLVEFCQTMCKEYGACGNVTKNLTPDRSETLIAPCHWDKGMSKKQKK